MEQLNLPPYEYKLKQADDHLFIWDGVRRKYVALTPEEWVRQNFIAFLVRYKGFPMGRLGNEITLNVNGRSRRCDTIAYGNDALPLVLIEYKAPHIAIGQKVLEQAVRYNIVLRVPYIILSNGMTHYCCRVDFATGQYNFLTDIPVYNELV